MTVHVVSVGIGIRDEFLIHPDRARRLVDHDLLHRLRDNAAGLFPQASQAELSAFLTAAFTDPEGAARKALETTAADTRPRDWPARASAELSSLACGRNPAVPYRLPEEDTAVLVASDTYLGLMCAVWNAVALTGGDLDRVRYLAEPTAHLGRVRGTVLIARVTGLDARTSAGFAEATRGLGRIGRGLARAAGHTDGGRFLFHLSGGFKAAVPYLIGLAEGLKSLGAVQVRAQVLHEFTEGAPIRIPLRSLAPALVRSELAVFGDGEHSPHPPEGAQPLRGYAYEEDSPTGGYRLTPFGAGLRELFGLEPPR